MADMQNPSPSFSPESIPGGEPIEEMQLDDARRIKVMSPGMLVYKRFIRNKACCCRIGDLVSCSFSHSSVRCSLPHPNTSI